MGKIRVRYIVADVDGAIPFYTELLGFQVDLHPAARLRKPVERASAAAAQSTWCWWRRPGDAGRPGPCPGGWNWIQIEVEGFSEELDVGLTKLIAGPYDVPGHSSHPLSVERSDAGETSDLLALARLLHWQR